VAGAWYLTIKERLGLKVCENRVLRRKFGPKREEGAGGWREPHNEELRNFHASPHIVRPSREGGRDGLYM
jgi:hypothetical protein